MSLRRKVLLSGPALALRNELGVRPMAHVFPTHKNINFSDLALWRHDDEFSTRFVMPDVPAEYLGVGDAMFSLQVLNSQGIAIKKIKLSPDKFGRIESCSDTWNLDPSADKGVFFIECYSDLLAASPDILHLKQRWYTGYKYKKGPYSMVHGNTLVFWNTLDGKERGAGITQSTFWRKFDYHLQFNPSRYDTCQLAFINPCKNKIKLKILKSSYSIPPFGLKMIQTSSEERISYSSNCCFLRPIVIGSVNDFIDVFHG